LGTFRTPIAKTLSSLIVELGDWQTLALCRGMEDPDTFFLRGSATVGLG